jgi:dihydropteroate synthase
MGERIIRLDQPRSWAFEHHARQFSDAGRNMSGPVAIAHASAMLEAGAAIIDIGGESTRPGAPVWEGDEIERIVPVIEKLSRTGAAISVDTRAWG